MVLERTSKMQWYGSRISSKSSYSKEKKKKMSMQMRGREGNCVDWVFAGAEEKARVLYSIDLCCFFCGNGRLTRLLEVAASLCVVKERRSLKVSVYPVELEELRLSRSCGWRKGGICMTKMAKFYLPNKTNSLLREGREQKWGGS